MVRDSELNGHAHVENSTLPAEDVETIGGTVEETVALILRNVGSLGKTLGMSELLVVRDVVTLAEKLVPVVTDNQAFGQTHVEIAAIGGVVTLGETVLETEGFVLKDAEILADTRVDNDRDELVLGAVDIVSDTLLEAKLLSL